jgi:transcriptional regulator with XRE-family HTH domain
MKAIGENIRKIRTIKGYSQDYVASKLKMSQNNYSRIELDQNKLNLDQLYEIGHVLEVDVTDILHFHEKYIFHSTSYNQAEGETKSGVFNNDSLIAEMKQDILFLQEENRRLIGIIETLKQS